MSRTRIRWYGVYILRSKMPVAAFDNRPMAVRYVELVRPKNETTPTFRVRRIDNVGDLFGRRPTKNEHTILYV